MKNPSRGLVEDGRMSGLHAGGHSDFINAGRCRERIRQEEAKLRRRLRKCKAKGIIGCFLLFMRRRQLLGELRKRFEVPYALFIGNHRWLPQSIAHDNLKTRQNRPRQSNPH